MRVPFQAEVLASRRSISGSVRRIMHLDLDQTRWHSIWNHGPRLVDALGDFG
jgi:hypothetical protein